MGPDFQTYGINQSASRGSFQSVSSIFFKSLKKKMVSFFAGDLENFLDKVLEEELNMCRIIFKNRDLFVVVAVDDIVRRYLVGSPMTL